MGEFSTLCDLCGQEFRTGNEPEHLANEHPAEFHAWQTREEEREARNAEFHEWRAEQERRERLGLPLC